MNRGQLTFNGRKMSILLLSWLLIMTLMGLGKGVQANPGPAVRANTVSYETELVSGDVRIPVITGLEDLDLENYLNKRWNKDITGFVEGVRVEAQAFFEEYGEELSHWLPFEVGVDYRVTYLDEGFVSIPIVYYSYTGGAHGFSYQKSTNVDLHTSKDVGLQDLFVPGYDYCQAIEDEILRHMQADPTTYFDETMAESEITSDHGFYLTKEGIVVYYGLYEVAPYSSGIPEFTIPFACVWEGLQPDIQALAKRWKSPHRSI